MGERRFRPSYALIEQGASTLAGGGVNVDAAPASIGPGKNEQAFARLMVTSSVAAFISINFTPATNAFGVHGYPLVANQPYTFDGPITSFSFNGASAGTVAWVGSA